MMSDHNAKRYRSTDALNVRRIMALYRETAANIRSTHELARDVLHYYGIPTGTYRGNRYKNTSTALWEWDAFTIDGVDYPAGSVSSSNAMKGSCPRVAQAVRRNHRKNPATIAA